MPLRQRFKRLKGHITDRLDTLLPPRRAGQSSVSLSNVPTPDTTLAAVVGQPSGSDSEDKLAPTSQYKFADPVNHGLHAASGSGHVQEQITSLHASTETSKLPSGVSTAATLNSWTGPKALLRVLDQSAGMFGPLKAVVDNFLACIEMYERVANGRKEFRVLQRDLEGLFEDLQRHFAHDAPPTVTSSMESLCKLILRELDYVKGKQTRVAANQYLDAEEDSDDILACYRRIQGHLQRLSLNSNLSMWKIADEQATDARLERLCPTLSACYNSAQAAGLKRGTCTPGTRVDVLAQMHGWVHSQSAGSVYWLNGMAGTGKTTIAYSLSTELEAANKLGASFFCSRALPDCRDVNLIIPSIAYQLAVFSRPFRYALSRVLEKERNAHTRLLRIQFESLIVKPLIAVRDTLPEDLVIVIDALDECDDQQSTGRILDALFTKTPDLPIKFFVSSRPEPEIRDQMKKQGDHKKSARLVLHELDKGTVQGDIDTYLREALAPIRPTEPQIATLVERAGILFIYAATVARYIGYDSFRRNPRARLETILNVSTPRGSNPYKEIDELYTVILRAAIDDPDLSDMEREDIKQVLYTAICAREPLTIGTLSGLLGLDDIERAEAALRPLWSVLHVVSTSGLVTTLHASFPDYMFDPKRSKEYHCDPGTHEHTLTRCCFSCVGRTEPQFNICRLESSYVSDEKIPNLKARIEETISSELYYACRYWASHLEEVHESSELQNHLEDFLSTGLLLWMEVMNVNRHMHDAVEMMRVVEGWCKRRVCSQELIQLMHDAWRFVAAFTSSPVSQSTPHLYVSMLPFWPESSPVAKHYAKRIQGPVVPQGPAIARRRLEHLATWPVDGEVSGLVWSSNGAQVALVAGGRLFVLDALTGRIMNGPLQQKSGLIQCIDYSFDGARIVSGSTDGTIRVWDAQSGTKILGPLKGHTTQVTSVSFSPDGARIVSGSWDNTIRLWDARNGKKVAEPLKEHIGWILSVAFSPDGARIASGGADHTVRLWDVKGGKMVLDPLQGHTNSVNSVAFSRDGTRIVSGDFDHKIYVWDAQSGKKMFGPFEEHTECVTSVSFSFDGTRIVSGSYDKTVYIWDTELGQAVLGPLRGHTNRVMSVAFSPDGTRIISGSRDKTIRVWDIQGGQNMLAPLDGHTSSVTSVAFSPDGTRIVSGSEDGTIRIWGAHSGQMMFALLEGNNRVKSVAFSPDGTRIASARDQRAVRVWDIENGHTVPALFEGHTNWVASVAFSPDGTRIASGSDDNTIRIWDARDRQTVLDPLKGHTNWVTSVAFAPDGTRIVSGSIDRTIRVWDITDGQMVVGPLEGHTDSVVSVAFSPDGICIASGSYDNTIRVWDTEVGQMVLGPLEGHADRVMSVSFSPDGARIASGSRDKTIRVWDTQSGKMVLGPLTGHTNSVLSVAFAPDNKYLVSGSEDNTIRVWDTQTETNMMSFTTAPHDSTPWNINADGWVVNQSGLLAWVPPDLRHILQHPRTTLLISTEGYVYLNLHDARVGESWTKCYKHN